MIIHFLSKNLFDYIVDGNCCKVAGWGAMENWDNANKLQEVGVPIFDLNTCASNYAKDCIDWKKCPTVTSHAFCAGGGEDKKDSCFVGYHY